jgi:splicing factor 3A subunit 2
MDFQNRVGGKTGSGGVLSESEVNVARRERLRKLALEAIDLNKDPYFLKNHLGSYECRLCLTLHNNEGSYLAHTQGKKHQANLGRRAAKEASLNTAATQLLAAQNAPKPEVPKSVIPKIGRPGYKVMKIRDPITKYPGLFFQIHYPNLLPNIVPRYRFMSAFEQKIEPPNKAYQYIVCAADPYETIAFKIPNRDLDNSEGKIFSFWDVDSRIFTVQVVFRSND